jgi:hypothetical protein
MKEVHSGLIVVTLLGCTGLVSAASCGGHGAQATGAGGQGTGGAAPSGSTGSAASGAGGTGAGGSGGTDGGAPSKGTPIGSFTGVNGLIADDPALLAPLGTVREYHNWGWICDNYAAGPAYPGMLYTFMNFNGWDWDVFFTKLKAQGVMGFPAVQGSVPWMNGSAIPPVPAGADKTAAASYAAHADAMFQIAARYGSVKVPDAQLKLKSTQTRVSGLGTVQYFEDFNEEDNASAFTPDAMAAMASADYDGDQKKLGATFGVKNADPSARLVMGGLSGAYPTPKWQASILAYLDGMRAWAAAHRGGSFPADVINVHYYSFGASAGQPAVSPEDDHVKDKLAAVVAYRDQYLPGKEVWWTEFGYDTYAQSPLGAPALGNSSSFIVQGEWLVRDFLAGLAAGVDRATLFELDDTCKMSDPSCHPADQFTTAGLVDGNGVKKPSWYFVATFRARLATMVYTGERSSGQSDVSIYAFKDTAGPGGALVVWCPTSSDHAVTGYALALPAAATTAKAVALADKQQNGVETSLTPAGGKVTLDVGESPTIVLVDAM